MLDRNKTLHDLIHDLNNKFTIIYYMLEHPEDNCKDKVKVALDSIMSVFSIISDMKRTLSYAEYKDNLKTVDAYEEIESLGEVASLLSKQYGIEIHITNNTKKGTLLDTDEKTRSKIMDNIIHNAKNAHATKIIWEHSIKDDLLVVRITDNGVGLDSDQLKILGSGSLFKDHGNGCRIIKENAYKLGGVVQWNSIKGIGTEILMFFPLKLK